MHFKKPRKKRKTKKGRKGKPARRSKGRPTLSDLAKKAREEPKVAIKAECHSDDHVVEASFDAVEWFEQASNEEILALAKCEWGGDYPADAVAEFMDGRHERVTEMFKYIRLVSKSKSIGFECHINDEDAREWIQEHRPNLVEQIETLGE